MKNVGAFLREAKAQDLLASAVLMLEALYFIIATAIVTGVGVTYAQGSANVNGALGMASLPLVAVGAFAVWGLALIHVLPPERPTISATNKVMNAGKGRCPEEIFSESAKRVAQGGFYVVVCAHTIYAIILATQNRYLLSAGIALLAVLLLLCSVTQMRGRRDREAKISKATA